jgi:hypothetical protein
VSSAHPHSSHQLISQRTFLNLVAQGTPMYATSSDSYYGVSASDLPTLTVHVTTTGFSNTVATTYSL